MIDFPTIDYSNFGVGTEFFDPKTGIKFIRTAEGAEPVEDSIEAFLSEGFLAGIAKMTMMRVDDVGQRIEGLIQARVDDALKAVGIGYGSAHRDYNFEAAIQKALGGKTLPEIYAERIAAALEIVTKTPPTGVELEYARKVYDEAYARVLHDKLAEAAKAAAETQLAEILKSDLFSSAIKEVVDAKLAGLVERRRKSADPKKSTLL